MSPKVSPSEPVPLAERRTQRERKQQAQTAIIRSAIAIIADKGLAGLTLAGAGEGAGYSRGIASHHFGKKDDLLIAVVNHITGNFSQMLAQDPDNGLGLPMILRVINRYLTNVENNSINVRALQLILTEAVCNPVLKPALEKVNHRSVKGLALNIQRGIADGDIRNDLNIDAQALLILTSLRGVMGQWLINPNEFDMASVRREFVDNVLRNLRA